MFKNNYLCNFLAVLVMFGSAASALAQEAAGYLSRTICYIVDHRTGAGTDMTAEGAELVGDTPDQYTTFIKSEPAKWGKAVKASGVKLD